MGLNFFDYLMKFLVTFFASVAAGIILYDIFLINIIDEEIFSIFLYVISFVISIFYTVYVSIKAKQMSNLKGGIFFEEKNDERNDYKLIRTHHILTENNYTLSKIQAIDDYFDEGRFLLFAKGIFIKLQEAWSKFDLDTIRLIETNELFEEHEAYLNELMKNKQINVIDKISVHSANIYSFEEKAKKEYLCVIINASMIEYMMDQETKEIISGDSEFKINVTYMLKFERRKGVKTKKDVEKRKKNVDVKGKTCLNCGAPLDPKLYGWCEYCMGINKDEEDWTLSGIEFFEK